VQTLLLCAVEHKPERHQLDEDLSPAQSIGSRVMAQIGGDGSYPDEWFASDGLPIRFSER